MSLARLNAWYKKHSILLTPENYRECIQADWSGFELQMQEPPNHHLKHTDTATVFSPLTVSILWLRPHSFYLGLLRDEQNTDFPMHSTERKEETQGPHSPASKARLGSKHLNKLGLSPLQSNSSHRQLIKGLPPAAGMCTFDSPRSLKGCKGTAENDHGLRAQ